MLTVSASKIQKYIDYRNDEIDYNNLYDYLAGVFEPSPARGFGTALHGLLQNYRKIGDYIVHKGGKIFYQFWQWKKGDQWTKEVIGPEIPAELFKEFEQREPKTGLFELFGDREIKAAGYDVRLLGFIDNLNGKIGRELKTTGNATRAIFENGENMGLETLSEYYSNQIQWKVYCYLFGLEKITYSIHIFNKNRDKYSQHYEFNLYPYDGMESEIIESITDFVLFCEKKDLLKLIDKPIYGGF